MKHIYIITARHYGETGYTYMMYEGTYLEACSFAEWEFDDVKAVELLI